MREGSDLFTVHAYMPAEASFGFADELRRRSSGAATASLLLSHWERLQVGCGAAGWGRRAPAAVHSLLRIPLARPPAQNLPAVGNPPPRLPALYIPQVDPFFVPLTEEEREEFGEEGQGVGSSNLAKRLIDAVRRRKGLAVEEKVVEFATKQRTRARKV
jgi:ribosome assembly protein 1